MSLNWGVYPTVVEESNDIIEIIDCAKKITREKMEINPDDRIVITGGVPTNVRGTNFIKIENL